MFSFTQSSVYFGLTINPGGKSAYSARLSVVMVAVAVNSVFEGLPAPLRMASVSQKAAPPIPGAELSETVL